MPYPIKTYKASPKVRLSRGPLGVTAKETAARVSRRSGALRGFQENAAGTGVTQSIMIVSSKFRGNPAPQIAHQVRTISHFTFCLNYSRTQLFSAVSASGPGREWTGLCFANSHGSSLLSTFGNFCCLFGNLEFCACSMLLSLE